MKNAAQEQFFHVSLCHGLWVISFMEYAFCCSSSAVRGSVRCVYASWKLLVFKMPPVYCYNGRSLTETILRPLQKIQTIVARITAAQKVSIFLKNFKKIS